jgi:hypothetical protein
MLSSKAAAAATAAANEETTRAAFLREVNLMAKLTPHPNVLQVLSIRSLFGLCFVQAFINSFVWSHQNKTRIRTAGRRVCCAARAVLARHRVLRRRQPARILAGIGNERRIDILLRLSYFVVDMLRFFRDWLFVARARE